MNNNLCKVISRAENIATELRKDTPNMRKISAWKSNITRWGKYYRQDINE
tara:strand:+ start:40 stop:189 length:150 start_codon:yes stop_codon:yes gene_type:complete